MIRAKLHNCSRVEQVVWISAIKFSYKWSQIFFVSAPLFCRFIRLQFIVFNCTKSRSAMCRLPVKRHTVDSAGCRKMAAVVGMLRIILNKERLQRTQLKSSLDADDKTFRNVEPSTACWTIVLKIVRLHKRLRSLVLRQDGGDSERTSDVLRQLVVLLSQSCPVVQWSLAGRVGPHVGSGPNLWSFILFFSNYSLMFIMPPCTC